MSPGTHMGKPQASDQGDVAPREAELRKSRPGGLKRNPIKIPVAASRGSGVRP